MEVHTLELTPVAYNFEAYLSKTPKSWHHEILVNDKLIDKSRALGARLLFLFFCKKYNIEIPEVILKNKWGKPYVEAPIFFNWSHAGNYAVLAVSHSSDIGIDIELKQPINLDEYRKVFSSKFFERIDKSADKHAAFYEYWTIHEALVKMLGLGIQFDFKAIQNIEDQFISYQYQGKLKRSPFQKIEIDNEYSCHIVLEDAEGFAIEEILKPINCIQMFSEL